MLHLQPAKASRRCKQPVVLPTLTLVQIAIQKDTLDAVCKLMKYHHVFVEQRTTMSASKPGAKRPLRLCRLAMFTERCNSATQAMYHDVGVEARREAALASVQVCQPRRPLGPPGNGPLQRNASL